MPTESGHKVDRVFFFPYYIIIKKKEKEIVINFWVINLQQGHNIGTERENLLCIAASYEVEGFT